MAWPGGMKSEKERDELRGRFTRFMEVTVRNARIDYLRKLKRQVPTVRWTAYRNHSSGMLTPGRPTLASILKMNAYPSFR